MKHPTGLPLLRLLLGLGLGLLALAFDTPIDRADKSPNSSNRLLRQRHRGHRHRGHRHRSPAWIPRLGACYDPALASHGFDRDRFPACAVLDAGRAQLYWRHDHNDSQITLGLLMGSSNSSTDGDLEHRWYALGLSAESQGMKGMDVAMLRPAGKDERGGPNSNGGWVLDDRWATDYSLPALDARQDKSLLSVVKLLVPAEHSRVVGFTFSMPLASCGVHDEERGQEDAPILPGRDTFVLWAQGTVDPDSGEPLYHGEHNCATRLPLGQATHVGVSSSRHSATASIVASDKGSSSRGWSGGGDGGLGVALPEDAEVLTVALPEMEIPTDATRYFCMFVQPPRDAKYHIYSARAVGDAAVAKELVHHMGLYAAGNSEVNNIVF